MTTTDHTDDPTTRRIERFSTTEPVHIDVSLGTGNVTVHLAANPAGSESTESTPGTEVVVELEHEPTAGGSWADGMNAMLNLFSSQFAEQFGNQWRGNPADALAQARVEQVGGRLVVHSPEALPLRGIPLAVTIHAPAGSDLSAKTSTGDVAVTGQLGRGDVSTSSGTVTLAGTSDRCRARTGSGQLRLGAVSGELTARSSSGGVEVTAASGSASVVTGSGAVWFGEVTGDVLARTGSGNIAVADARSGTLELNTGSGDLRIGIGSGVTSEIDVSSGTGRVLSELDVAGEAPSEQSHLRIHARTGTGNAVLRQSGL